MAESSWRVVIRNFDGLVHCANLRLTYGLFIDRGAIRDLGRHFGKHVGIDEQSDRVD